MVGAIKGCTGVDPTIVGKPSPLMIDYIIQKYGVERCVRGAPPHTRGARSRPASPHLLFLFFVSHVLAAGRLRAGSMTAGLCAAAAAAAAVLVGVDEGVLLYILLRCFLLLNITRWRICVFTLLLVAIHANVVVFCCSQLPGHAFAWSATGWTRMSSSGLTTA